jgi:hypothetical protein
MSSSARIGLEMFTPAREQRLQRYKKPAAPESRHVAMSYERMKAPRNKGARTIDYLALAATAKPVHVPFKEGLRRIATIGAGPVACSGALDHLRVAAELCRIAEIQIDDPSIGRGDDGSIGIDWRHDGRRLAITFEASGEVEFYAKGPIEDAHGRATSPAMQTGLLVWLAFGPRPFPGE